MLGDLLTRAGKRLTPVLIAVAALIPLAPATAMMLATAPPSTAPPPTNPNGGGHGPPMMPPMGGDMPGMGGMPGNDGDGPGNGPGDWMSNPMLMRQQMDNRNNSRTARFVPPAITDGGEAYIPDEVVFTVSSPDKLADILKSNRIYVIEQTQSELAGVTVVRARILDQRPVMAVAAAVGADPAVMLTQPDFVYRLQYAAPAATSTAPPLQYALGRLRLTQAHGVARGNEVLVGMIDSAVDRDHPDLDGAIVAIFDATAGGAMKHAHGTAVASLIAGRGKLTGAAPAARLLVARAFDTSTAKGNTFTVLKSLDWLASRSARVINLSFAGASDPLIHRALKAAHDRNIILIAAAGNGGPGSPPLYPAADASVLAVTATDSSDRLYQSATRGSYIAIAAPGVDLFVAAPDDGYAIQSGTSFSCAEVSGIAALMLQRRPNLTPDALRAQLLASAHPLGGGIRLADAYGAVTGGQPASARPKPRGR